MNEMLGVVYFNAREASYIDNKLQNEILYHDNHILFYCQHTQRGAYHIQFRGKLYNHKILKQRLSLVDEIDDSTLIVEAYRAWGKKFIKELDGIFAFVLYDQKNAITLLVKDRVSIKPFYFYHDNNRVIFSSSLKKLTNSGFFQKEIDKHALSNYFTYGYILQPNTIYKNCYKIKSGHYIIIDIKTKKIQEEKYWDLGESYDIPKRTVSDDEAIDEARNLLQQSIAKRLETTKNYAASLSGGYDSSTLVALLQEQSTTPLKTFTIGFEDAQINEAPEAKKIAQHLGTDHTEYYFSDDNAKEIIPQLSEVYDEPFYDNGSIPTILLSKFAAQQGVETIFAGDGGDEVFATADDSARFDKILAIPSPMRQTSYEILNLFNPQKIPFLKDCNNFPTKYYKFINILHAEDIPSMVRVKMTLFHPSEIERLLNSSDIAFKSIFDSIYFGEHAESVDKIIGSYFKTFLTDGELVKTTQAFKHVGLHIREPYLDPKLIAYMATIPASLKIKNATKKYILKEIAHQYIPKSLLDRPKKGFSVPFSAWMRGTLYPLMMETLCDENIKKDSILNVDYVRHLKNEFLKGNEAYRYKLWSILLYQLWYEKNFR